MTREDIKELLINIKSFYPRFSLVDTNSDDEYVVRSQTLDAWYGMIGYKTKEECDSILRDYIAGPNGDKAPSVGLFAAKRKSGDVLTGTAYRKNYEVIYQPDKGEDPKRLFVIWTGSAWQDIEGRMWAEPEEPPHPELVDRDFKWEGEGEFANQVRKTIWPYTDEKILDMIDKEVETWEDIEKRIMGG